MKQLFLLGLLLAFPACQSTAPTAAQAARLDQARAMLPLDPDRALAIADELLRERSDWRQARLLVATGSLQMAQDPTRPNRELLLQDAIASFELAVDLDDSDPECQLQLCDARMLAGQGEAAALAAEAAVELLAETNRTADQQRAALRLARARMQHLVTLRRAELARPDPKEQRPERATAELAGTIMTLVKQPALLAAATSECYRIAASLEEWMGQPDLALLELENGINSAPTDSELHLALQELYARLDQLPAMCGFYSRLGKQTTDTPALLWYQGRAEVMLADSLRQKGAFQKAADTYQVARDCFGQYRATQPAHADAAAEWLAILDLAMARTLVDIGDLEGAQEHLFACDAIGADKLLGGDGSEPLRDSFGNSYANTAAVIGQALAQTGDDRLRNTLSFHETLLQRHPETWGWAYNNAGLAARDLGVQIEHATSTDDAAAQQQAHATAMALWERSYGYYEIAARLSPDDPRIVNDTGLMLLYHLDRDLDRAHELFVRAIAVGQPQLDQLPADAKAEDRNFLEEAVGDAYQNLAVLQKEHEHLPFEQYRENCERSLQYYPGRQRAAVVRMIRDGEQEADAPALPASSKGGSGPAAAVLLWALPQGQDGVEQKLFEKVRAAAAAKAKDGDFDGALAALDEAQKPLKDYAPFRAVRGDYNLRLARAARDSGRRGVEFLFADAVSELQRAVELDSEPVGPRLMLAQVQNETGEFAAAATTASRLLLHMQSLGKVAPEDFDAAHAVRAAAAARVFCDAGGVDKDTQLQEARLSFKHLEKRQKLDAAMLTAWSSMEQWAKAPAEAVGIFARALQQAPEDQALLGGLCDTARNTGEVEPALQVLGSRTDALGLWYLGRCQFAHGAALRGKADNAGAIKALQAAVGSFEQSMQKNASYQDSCQQWLAWCYGKLGSAAFAGDDLDNAERWLLQSAKLRPDQIEADLGLQDSTKMGILYVASKYVKTDPAHAERIFRAASDAANADVDLLNNAGLCARDLGDMLERRGRKAEAREMHEQSYKAYSRCQQLDPQNVRLCNDTALLLVYSLERDWDHAKELLEHGIQVGEQQMRDEPPADRQQRQDLDEAIGDCYENLALWHLKHGGDLAAARAAAESSMQHHPKDGRGGARRHLADIARREGQGK